MCRRLIGLAAALLLLTPAAAQEPSQQVQALQRELQAKQLELSRQITQLRASYAPRFLEIAEKNPKDPAALEALTWVLTNAGTTPEAAKAVLMLTDHAASEKMDAALIARMRAVRAPGVERFLRAVAEKNPKREVQGNALLALAQSLKQQSERGVPAATKEAEKILEQLVAKYGDVKSGRGTLADAARTELAEIRAAIVVGSVIPEIDGEDMDGKKFKISEYRGKVVMLDFWAHW